MGGPGPPHSWGVIGRLGGRGASDKIITLRELAAGLMHHLVYLLALPRYIMYNFYHGMDALRDELGQEPSDDAIVPATSTACAAFAHCGITRATNETNQARPTLVLPTGTGAGT